MERPRPSSVAWTAIGAGVLAYEILAPEGELLSERVDAMLERPITRAAAIAAVGSTALHLLNVFDVIGANNLDPYHQVGKLNKYFKKQPQPMDALE